MEHHEHPSLHSLIINLVVVVVALLQFIAALWVLGVPKLIKFLAQWQWDRSTLFNYNSSKNVIALFENQILIATSERSLKWSISRLDCVLNITFNTFENKKYSYLKYCYLMIILCCKWSLRRGSYMMSQTGDIKPSQSQWNLYL